MRRACPSHMGRTAVRSKVSSRIRRFPSVTLGNLRMRLETFERTAVRPMWDGQARRIDLRRQDAAGSVMRLQAVLASYTGHLRHGAAWRAWEALCHEYPW